ncbi:MAG TPA: hypothetical protein VNC18_14800 [Gemmatimonadaceae bacterium]|jgi:hypothetical protein|nr:hypothetical protein [Gemmatimonadaceae bacterium]
MPLDRSRTSVAALALATLAPVALSAQLIQIKTLPIADGDQWRIFPSANAPMADLSIALADSLLDPFVNPAKGARLPDRGLFFGSPTFYSVSQNAGGGRTLPLGGVFRFGSMFGGFALALQELDTIRGNGQVFFPPVATPVATDPAFPATTTTVTPTAPSRENRFAFASLGRSFSARGLAVAGSVLWSGLRNIDGVDLLYTGSQAVNQHGGALDARLGLTKEWSTTRGARSAEAILLHNRFDMTHDVTWADQVFDPNTRAFLSRPRIDHNLDKTNTWGLHLAYSQPLADSGWRIGAIATTNLASHPKLPDYQIAQVMVIPWDPGHTTAYDLGLGVSKSHGPTTLGVEAVFEPITTHTWGEAHGPMQSASGSAIPDGGMTTENQFRFSNAILRAGAGHDLQLSSDQAIRLQAGVALRSISYGLDQTDHVAETRRHQDEHWVEWTRTWGLSFRFSDLEMRYAGRSVTGTGRPGITQNGGVVFAAADALTSNFLAAPAGPLTLTDVRVTTHQFSISVPLR